MERARSRTRLWSMISAITAIFPADGPDLRKTTVRLVKFCEDLERLRKDAPRPTSTKRLKFESCKK